MSERRANPLEREWRFYVDDMIGFAEKVRAYTEGMGREDFGSSGLVYDATLRNLEMLGEAATHIPDHARALAPEIPWRMIVATRNRLAHAYLGIDDDTLWSIVIEDLPALLSQLTDLRKASS